MLRFRVHDIDDMIERGEIHDGWSISTWCLARKRVLELVDQYKKKG